MQGIINVMESVFHSIKAEGSYFILFIASLYILYRINSKKNQWYIYYALLSILLIVANPFVVMLLSKAFPVLGAYSIFVLFIPVLLFIPFAAGELYERMKEKRQGKLLGVLLVIVIGISGNLYGVYQNENTGKLVCQKEQEEVLKLAETNQVSLLLADESVLPYVRIKTPSVRLLYGRDLYQPGMDLGIMDGYDEEMLRLYEAMKNPEETIQDILATADLYGCDMVIVKWFDGAPKEIGHFKQLKSTSDYIVYTIA